MNALQQFLIFVCSCIAWGVVGYALGWNRATQRFQAKLDELEQIVEAEMRHHHNGQEQEP